MNRLLIIANRLPVSVTVRSGNISFQRSPGGLASGLASLPKSYDQLWIGWPGITSEKLKTDDRAQITEKLADEKCRPVFLSDKQVENYYRGFSNKTIWPLFHYFPLHTLYEKRFWKAYQHVNQLFCSEIVDLAGPTDRIWIHDYHLMLLPRLIRQKLPEAQIGFFLHIPFPSFELFRLLPWREEILHGLLGADVIGFHTYDYVRHFLSSACRIVGLEHTLGELTVQNRIVKVDAFPMGIDYEKYSQAASLPAVQQEIRRIRQKVGDCKTVLSVDRLDYTKGIIQRLEAFDLFLSENPEYRGKVTLIMVAVPSRTRVPDYVKLREDLEQLVGRVNGEHGTIGWMPVWYLYRFLPFERLTALYHLCDVALVTPLRDGMNLIAKEFIAGKTDGRGVLILSEMTGAASELGEALIVNANNKAAIVEAIKHALQMPEDEQIRRNRLMQNRLSRYNIFQWSLDFLNALSNISNTQKQLSVRRLSQQTKQELVRQYTRARKRLLLLDYDGTVVPFTDRPERAGPDKEILALLQGLSEDAANCVVVISGRDKATLTDWLGHLDIALVAEHGAWIKEKAKQWQSMEMSHHDWKDAIKPILELYSDRTPGALVEEKDFSLVWHFRKADRDLAQVRGQELKDHLMNLTANLDVGVFEGSKIIEIRHLGINKGRAVELWLAKQMWDFIIAAGDDYTDEEMFAVLPETAYSIKVGRSISKARFNIDSVTEMRLLLKELTGEPLLC
ncbi:MAG TPA: bifunctional alpha,alpha-trehalose-phosphate synthase (UDP-forming)/trehalose-phosphatase [Sedimentisphaerales bacterium]|nr:bifunctional alpha,alpha-trehalose-phosphate synthase (UDP-forming)/trehalose-phosphatase [Sedimentisphaerales bacterium]